MGRTHAQLMGSLGDSTNAQKPESQSQMSALDILSFCAVEYIPKKATTKTSPPAVETPTFDAPAPSARTGSLDQPYTLTPPHPAMPPLLHTIDNVPVRYGSKSLTSSSTDAHMAAAAAARTARSQRRSDPKPQPQPQHPVFGNSKEGCRTMGCRTMVQTEEDAKAASFGEVRRKRPDEETNADTTLRQRPAVSPWQRRLHAAMRKSQGSLKDLQRYDKANGNPRSHASTMVRTERSRKQLLEGRILKKWDGTPLISFERGRDGSVVVKNGVKPRARPSSKKRKRKEKKTPLTSTETLVGCGVTSQKKTPSIDLYQDSQTSTESTSLDGNCRQRKEKEEPSTSTKTFSGCGVTSQKKAPSSDHRQDTQTSTESTDMLSIESAEAAIKSAEAAAAVARAALRQAQMRQQEE